MDKTWGTWPQALHAMEAALGAGAEHVALLSEHEKRYEYSGGTGNELTAPTGRWRLEVREWRRDELA